MQNLEKAKWYESRRETMKDVGRKRREGNWGSSEIKSDSTHDVSQQLKIKMRHHFTAISREIAKKWEVASSEGKQRKWNSRSLPLRLVQLLQRAWWWKLQQTQTQGTSDPVTLPLTVSTGGWAQVFKITPMIHGLGTRTWEFLLVFSRPMFRAQCMFHWWVSN